MKLSSMTLLLAGIAVGCSRPSASAPRATLGGQAGHGNDAVERIKIVSETLPSGYGVVLARITPDVAPAPGIFVGSYVRHGSMEEGMLGWAHLMEHVAANNRSTIRGPTPPEGVRVINSNALARPYYTSFVTNVPLSLLPSVLHSRMGVPGRAADDPAVFRNEVTRVLTEIGRDTAGLWPAYKALVALALGRSPRLADEMESIRTAVHEDVVEAMVPIYQPSNAVLVIAGDIDLAETRALVHETAARLQLDQVRRPASPTVPARVLRTGESVVVTGQNRGVATAVGVAWPRPPFGHGDQLPMLVLDQLLLGRGGAVDDPSRSDESPLAVRLARTLGGRGFWDGRASVWGAPDMVDTGTGLHAVLFYTDHAVTPEHVRNSIRAALLDIRRTAMSDAEITTAAEALASFYEQWLLEPSFRILADHLMALRVAGKNVEDIKRIPDQIRSVRPAAVRAAVDTYLLDTEPLLVILPSTQPAG